MLDNLRRHKFIIYMTRFIICYFLVCNIFGNFYYHLKASEKVEKVVVRTPTQQEFVVTSEDIIEKVNRQFHMQILFFLGWGSLKEEAQDGVWITFYNDKNKEVKGFEYNPANKKIYPGEIELPSNTVVIMDELISMMKKQSNQTKEK